MGQPPLDEDIVLFGQRVVIEDIQRIRYIQIGLYGVIVVGVGALILWL
jgi:hypothetical protein